MSAETQVAIYHTPMLFVALELASKSWKVATSAGAAQRARVVSVDPYALGQLEEELAKARRRFGLPPACEVKAVMEAGRDGFAVHRWLADAGIESIVIDPASVEVSRHQRRAKTDRLDARMLLRKLRSYMTDRDVFQVIRVPSEEVEDQRRPSREYDRLVHERTQHCTRINSLLALHGIALPFGEHFVSMLKDARTPTGEPLGKNLQAEILRELERMELVEHQIAEIQKDLKRAVEAAKTKVDVQGAKLGELVGIGPVTAMTLPREFLWRDFQNRGEVGAAAGLTGTPHVTGTSTDIEQGISKAGNKRVRTLMIEIAWNWVRLQPESTITLWFRSRQDGTARTRRKTIVGVARKLLIALWRYVTQDIAPEGARFRAASA